MNDRQLICFLTACETLNFSRAAQRLFITQPALSYQVRSLEKELGTELFWRSTTQVRLTEAGLAFLEPARRLSQQYLEALDAVRPFAARQQLVLALPAVMTLRDPIYHRLLHRIHEALPGYDIQVRTEVVDGPVHALLSTGVDLALTMRPERDETGVVCTPLFQTGCYLVAGPRHPVASRPELAIPDLNGQHICYEPGERVYIRYLQSQLQRRGGAAHWAEVASYELSYPDMLTGKSLFVSPMRYDVFPLSWYRPLRLDVPLPPTCLFTLAADQRPCIPALTRLVCDAYQERQGDDPSAAGQS